MMRMMAEGCTPHHLESWQALGSSPMPCWLNGYCRHSLGVAEKLPMNHVQRELELDLPQLGPSAVCLKPGMDRSSALFLVHLAVVDVCDFEFSLVHFR
jgi:hypothetical protein